MSNILVTSVSFIMVLFFAPPAIALQCIVLDVGEGQAVLVVEEQRGVLIDTGNFAEVSETLRRIQEYGVVSLDHVLLTHLHADHASGIFRIMEEYPDAVIHESGHRIPFRPDMDPARWVAENLDAGIWKVKKIRQGDRLKWQDVVFHVYWPLTPVGNLLNPQSLVIGIERGGKTLVLLMGDVGHEQEEYLVHGGYLPASAAILVAGHHGAADATGKSLLAHIRPLHVAVSTNKNNVRGYPDEGVRERIRDMGGSLLETRHHGDIVYHLP